MKLNYVYSSMYKLIFIRDVSLKFKKLNKLDDLYNIKEINIFFTLIHVK